jgi:hypothetical protein
MQDASGFTSLKKINEMTKIEFQYFQRHENNFEASIPDGVVILPGQVLTSAADEIPSPIRIDPRNVPRIGLMGGRFQARR